MQQLPQSPPSAEPAQSTLLACNTLNVGRVFATVAAYSAEKPLRRLIRVEGSDLTWRNHFPRNASAGSLSSASIKAKRR